VFYSSSLECWLGVCRQRRNANDKTPFTITFTSSRFLQKILHRFTILKMRTYRFTRFLLFPVCVYTVLVTFPIFPKRIALSLSNERRQISQSTYRKLAPIKLCSDTHHPKSLSEILGPGRADAFLCFQRIFDRSSFDTETRLF